MILIVDDQAWFVSPLRDALEYHGFKTMVAAGADECMQVIEGTSTVDAVILDVMLPPGNLDIQTTECGQSTGLVLLRQIREKLPDVPIVVSSVRTDLPIQSTDDPPTLVLSKGELTIHGMIETLKRMLQPGKESGG